MPHDVFISYCSADKAVADAICASIEGAGRSVWIAPRDILPGKGYGGAIIAAINASRLMIVVFSSHSNGSEQVLREVERAVSKRVPIIPFRIEGVQPTESMEYFLSHSHWLDALSPPREPQIEQLKGVIDQLLNEPPQLNRRAGDNPGTGRAAALPVDKAPPKPRRAMRYAAAAAVAVAIGAAAAAWYTWRAAPVEADTAAIAVLPFHNLQEDKSIDYLSLAMPAELDSQLSRSASVIVRPLDSVKAYKDQNWTAADVARTLHVATVVEGSYWRADQQLRVKVDIVDSHHNREVWSEPFQVALTDLLNLIDQVVQKVTVALRLRMAAEADQTALGTGNPDVYDLYLRSLTLAQEITDQNNNNAIGLLKQAVSLDPGFARAHAALADAYVTRFYWNFSNETSWLDLAEASAREALKLDASLPEAHQALGFALEGKGERGAAVREYFASLRAGPHYVPALKSVARFAFYMADFDRSLATLDTIATIDPMSNVHVRRAMDDFFAGRTAESARENQEAEKHAQGVDQLTLVAFTYAWLKDFDSAERVLRRLQQLEPAAPSIAEVRAWLYTMRGDTDAAREQMTIIGKRETFGIADEIATLYAAQGDGEDAIDWLTKAVHAGAPNYAWYRSDFFKVLRGDPRYEAILKELSDEYADVRAASPLR